MAGNVVTMNYFLMLPLYTSISSNNHESARLGLQAMTHNAKPPGRP
jgi:hypothetical protein